MFILNLYIHSDSIRQSSKIHTFKVPLKQNCILYELAVKHSTQDIVVIITSSLMNCKCILKIEFKFTQEINTLLPSQCSQFPPSVL